MRGYLFYAALIVFISSLIIPGAFADHSFQVEMRLTNTDATVYVPGAGEVTAGSLTPAVYTSPMHYFVSSHKDGLLTGLVHHLETPYSVSINRTAGSYSLKVNQSINRSMVFAVFSKGDRGRIDSVIDLIEAQIFLGKSSPTFGFGLGKDYDIKMYLSYDNIDFVGNNMTFNRGNRLAIATNNGTVVNKASIIFKSF